MLSDVYILLMLPLQDHGLPVSVCAETKPATPPRQAESAPEAKDPEPSEPPAPEASEPAAEQP